MDSHSVIPDGTITSAKGFLAGAVHCGLRQRKELPDLTLLVSEREAAAAGVFTRNKVRAGSVTVCIEHLAASGGKARAIIVNSGSANACVGEQSVKDAGEMAALAARKVGVPPEQVLIASTGVIGVELPMGLIRKGVPRIPLSQNGGNNFARAIMTTDLVPKEAAVSLTLGGKDVVIGGAAKGSGMIHPDMATMLAFIATDAAVEQSFLQAALRRAADVSFNMVSVDGDTSTNDCVLLLANGAAGNGPVAAQSPEAAAFEDALAAVCKTLAIKIAQDGEGAKKLITVIVSGARSDADARQAARTIVSSNLLKTAVHGSDPNWGRVLAALGRSGAEIEESKIRVEINGICTLDNGVPIPFYKEAAKVAMSEPEVVVRVSLNLGDRSATAWGCDLTAEYVTINSAYTT
ncbi:MAG: bifunctional glutamate N-acetyltransferase/amino-acid acetyltransferase ArgJ [Chloroflexi bacterium]|nr:bifunctional glutamate N-acetyltransferase/amino-acid acetyltransferase ArgJ [Chloroflexota bacterium]